MVVTRAVPPRKQPAPSPGGRSRWSREHGQASVEFVALLPILALIALALAQAALAGWTAWSAAGAARVGARAHALGHDPALAARRVLPAMLGRRARVSVGEPDAGREGDRARRPQAAVTVRLRIPVVLPGVRLGSVAAGSTIPSQVGT